MRSASQILSLTILGFALLTAGLGLSSPAQAGDVPLPNPAKAFKGEQCIEPTDVMRRNHFDFLKHQRDETLREGIRGQKYSLNDCIDCHAVTSPDVAGGKLRTLKPFCKECHDYAAVSIDCFSCHTGAAVPGIGKQSALPADHSDKAMIAVLEKHLDQEGAKP
ncbi:hypothetical protein V5T82_05000 [Magnetovibrio sp. PR-2]|uniref:hypothetical protein n=1 Tax=Magnetovibrio sp. PR-2 TaxID=3120356 RepID=UPI002FCE4A83